MTVRRGRIMGITPVIFIGGLWAVSIWLSGRIESTMTQGAGKRVLDLTWDKSSWDPLRGT